METARSNGRDKPTTVAVWGIGMVGSALVQFIARNPELELVAGLGYNPDNKGRDVGEVAGAGHLGVTLTLEPQDLIDAQPDVVLYTARDTGVYASDDDLLRLLKAGIDTVTALPYANLGVRGSEVEQRFKAAAEAGGSTFMVAGVDPDYMWERQVLTASGLCGEITGVSVTEIFRGDTLGEQMMPLFGFGRSVEEARNDAAFHGLVYNYFAPSMQWACAQMGFPLDEVTIRSVSEPAEERIEHPLITIEPGTVGLAATRLEGKIDGEVFATHDVRYHVGVNRPEEAPVDECWIVDIEGRPSLRVVVQSMASVREGTDRYPDDSQQISPGYWVSAAPLIRAIDLVLAAPPGIKEAAPPEMRFSAVPPSA